MRATKHSAETPLTPNTGLLAMLASRLRLKGTGAPTVTPDALCASHTSVTSRPRHDSQATPPAESAGQGRRGASRSRTQPLRCALHIKGRGQRYAPVIVVLACLAGGATPATAATPWFRLTSRTIPTHIAPGGEGTIILQAINLGNAETAGKYTFTDNLPAHLKLEGTEFFAPSPIEGGPDFGPGSGEFGALELCQTTASSATCSSESAKFNFEFLSPVAPYDLLEMRLRVKEEGVEPEAVNETQLSGGGAPTRSIKREIPISSSPAGFGIGEFLVHPEEEGGEADTHAGTHPYQLTYMLNFNRDSTLQLKPPAMPRNLEFKLPPGQVGNATAVPQCDDQDFAHVKEGGAANSCPVNTAIGVAVVTLAIDESHEGAHIVPVFNLTPAVGEPARFGFEVLRSPVILDTSVRSGAGEDYGVTVSVRNIPQTINFDSATTVFWGAPTDPSHNESRGWGCLLNGFYRTDSGQKCELSSDAHPPAFLTLPANCAQPFDTSLTASSWPTKAAPEGLSFGPVTYNLADDSGNPLSLTGCNQLVFAPTLQATPTSESASSPTGLNVNLNFDDEGLTNSTGTAQSQIKDTTVTLPEGLTINPSSGVGLGGCTPADYERETLESAPGVGCPNNSKLGTVDIQSPLIKQTIHGSLFVAQPHENPFNSLIALYIVAKNPETGVIIKLAGRVEAGGQAGVVGLAPGQLRTTFKDNPQLPFSHFNFHFREGQQAPLITPATCGTYTTDALLSPWSEPASILTDTSPFSISSGSGGGACPSGVPPFSPQMSAGTTSNAAGSFSPFDLHLSRTDGEGEITDFATTLPPGLSAVLTGVPFCPEADIALARTKTGAEEEASPSCPAASLLGHSQVGTGVGQVLAYTPGRVYLAGPFNGDPFSLVFVTSAVVGPFDLGTVVIRLGLRIDPRTAQAIVEPSSSEPIPHIIDGIVTHVRDIRVQIDRPNFMVNPTSCAPLSIAGTLGSNQGQSTTVSSPFQAASCASLKFSPTVAVATAGKASKANGASLNFKIAYPKGALGTQSWFNEAKFDIPKQLPARLTTIQKACLAATFEANRAACPAASKIGHAIVKTPVLPVPLEGPVYFVSYGGAKFPDAVLVLDGYGVHIELHGETFINGKTGVTSATFRNTPDVPFDSIEVNIPTGPFSEFGANLPAKAKYNFCGQKLVMPTLFKAQNGLEIHRNTAVSVSGCGKAKQTRAQKLAAAMKACKKKHGAKRASCQRAARKRYGTVKKAKKSKAHSNQARS